MLRIDLAQSSIGPGMSVFSRYRRVLEADGTAMSVRSALQVINEEVDLYFNEQVGSMDTASRFCIDLYTQCAYNDIKYGEAEVLANAKGTSIPMMAAHGMVFAKAGVVHLVERESLSEKIVRMRVISGCLHSSLPELWQTEVWKCVPILYSTCLDLMQKTQRIWHIDFILLQNVKDGLMKLMLIMHLLWRGQTFRLERQN